MICPKFHPENTCPKFHPLFLLGKIPIAKGPPMGAGTINRKNSSVFHNIYSAHVLFSTEFQSNEARGLQ